MSRAKIIYWRDIPTQVVVGSGRKSTKRPLADRFLVAVDKAAMTAGRTSDEDYIADWHSTEIETAEDDAAAAAEAVAASLEHDYPTARLAELARNGGNDPEKRDGQ